MKVVQCPNGHYYNQEMSPFCPVCGKDPEDEQNIVKNETECVLPPQGTKTNESEDITVSIFDEKETDDSMTVMMLEEGKMWSPVVGWAVCVEGPGRGRDYRIHSQRNFIGRAGDMDISVFEDDKIAMRSHCSIVHEPIRNEFMLVPGEDYPTYYNGNTLVKYTKLSEGDRFTIGKSTFVFVPFCKGDVCW